MKRKARCLVQTSIDATYSARRSRRPRSVLAPPTVLKAHAGSDELGDPRDRTESVDFNFLDGDPDAEGALQMHQELNERQRVQHPRFKEIGVDGQSVHVGAVSDHRADPLL